MALSPADFAAYSRATGAPYPESPEERAQMVPEVRAFRQNQLQQSDNQGSNAIALGIGLGLGLAGLGAGAMKLRGRGKGQPKKDVAGKSSVKMTDLSDQQVPKSKTQVYKDVAAKAEEDLPEVTRPKGGVAESMLVTDPETGEVYRRGGSASVKQQQAQENLSDRVNQLLSEVSVGEAGEMLAGPEVAAETRQMTGTESSRQSAAVRRLEKEEESLAKNILSELADETPTLTETYEAFGEPAAQVQSVEAINTAADQAAAPVERAMQRNEDVDVSAAQRFLNDKRLDLEAKGLSPTRVERVLASNSELIEAAELFASTGDEAVLSRFSEQPSSPVTVKPKSVLSLDADEVATGSLFKPGTFGEFIDDLEGKDIELTNRISSLGEEQQQLVGRRKQLEEDSLMIKSAMDREPAGRDDYSRMYGQMQYEMQNMPDPASLNVDIGDAMAERENVRAQIKGLKDVGAQQFLIDQTEGSRAFYEVNPATNEVIPETLEIRPGRKSIELTKGGGGRNVSEFTAGLREPDLKGRTVFLPVDKSSQRSKRAGAMLGPWPKDSLPATSSVTVRTRRSDDIGNQLTGFEGDRTQTGGGMGLYGPERTGERATAGQRPTQPTMDETISQALADSVADELGVPTPPAQDLVFVDEQKYQKPDRKNRLRDAEILRRTAIEGRPPQSSLAGRAQRQSRPRIAALRQEATRRKAAGEPLMSKTEAFNFLSNYVK